MDKVVCPIGLEVGGNSPKEIAISVVAQLLQVHYSE
jgi:xanthine dehydrogenase accessory factor